MFGLSFYENNTDKLKVATMGGISPSVETVATGKYPVSRPLFFYVKKAHVERVPGIREYVAEFTRDAAVGEFGYLADNGLIPLADDERAAVQTQAKNLAELHLGNH